MLWEGASGICQESLAPRKRSCSVHVETQSSIHRHSNNINNIKIFYARLLGNDKRGLYFEVHNSSFV